MKTKLHEQPYRRPIGFFEALQSAKGIHHYYELVRLQNFSYIHDQTDRDELKNKYPEFFSDANPMPNQALVSKEINKYTVTTYNALQRINAPTSWRSDTEELEYDFDDHKNKKVKKTEKYDVILDRQYPVYRNKRGFNDTETTYHMLEEAEAVFDHIWKTYWRKIINPLWWIAFILRLPIGLMEHMGLNASTENINKFVYWLTQAIVLLILSFASVKLGISINIPSIK